MQVQIIVSLLTILGAGVSVYVGVRVALAEMKRDIRAIEESHTAFQRLVDRDQSALDRRIQRIEEAFFRPK